MRNRFLINALICFCFMTACIFSVKAAENVEVEMPKFDISFNGVKVEADDARYPIIVYKDVTYIPVEDKHTVGQYNYMSALGFVCGEGRSNTKYRKLFVRDLWLEKNIPDVVAFEKNDGAYDGDMTAQVVECSGIIVNRFGNVREVSVKEYPILSFRGKEYLPMTYDVACTGLGLSMKFSSEKGLELSRTNIPQRIVSVPSFDVTLNGVKYRNEVAKYPFLQYNNIVFMPLTENIADFMGIKFRHYDARANFYECVVVGNKHERGETADFGYIKEGESFSFGILEPFDGELYINGFATRWHNFGMEYSPMMVGDVCYLPLTWQIAHDHLGWEYSFDMKNGLVLDSRNTFKPEFDIDTLPTVVGYSREYYVVSGDHYVGYSAYSHKGSPRGSNKLIFGKRGDTEKVVDISEMIEKYDIAYLHPQTGAVPQPRIEGGSFVAYWNGYRFVFNLDTGVLSAVTQSEF